MTLMTTPDDLGPCQVYCEQLKDEVRRLRALLGRCREWPEYAADLNNIPLGATNFRVAVALLADIDAALEASHD